MVDGAFVVVEPTANGGRQVLASFRLQGDGRPGKLKHVFEAPQTRNLAEEIFRRWNEQRQQKTAPPAPAKPPAPAPAVDKSQERVDPPAPSRQTAAAPAAAPAPTASPNRIFTADAAAAARERLRKKLNGGQLNAGIDPEIIQDGITLAGYHIEAGARRFAAYARAMIDDLGDAVKPYLVSWYMAVRSDPRAVEFRGEMQRASEVEDLTAADIDRMLAQDDAPAPSPVPAPAADAPVAPVPDQRATGATGADQPFGSDFARLEGRTLTQRIELPDGRAATMTIRAAEAMRDLDQRENALRQLLECLEKRA